MFSRQIIKLRHRHLSTNQSHFFQQQQQQQTNVIFNKKARIAHLDRASGLKDAQTYDYIKRGVAKDICDRIKDLTCNYKRVVYNLGSALVHQFLDQEKVEMLIHSDISKKTLERSYTLTSNLKFPVLYINCDEERLPLKDETVDIVISSMNLHWVNDLVACFRHVHRTLKDDRPFVGAMLGGDTLFELRSTLQMAELERLSGFSSHVSPKTTGQDVAGLLQGTGFKSITVDITEVRICFPSIFELLFDLQDMGESNATVHGSRHMNREVLQASAAIYQYLYGNEGSDFTKGVPATFQVIHFIGWKNPTKATTFSKGEIDSLGSNNV